MTHIYITSTETSHMCIRHIFTLYLQRHTCAYDITHDTHLHDIYRYITHVHMISHMTHIYITSTETSHMWKWYVERHNTHAHTNHVSCACKLYNTKAFHILTREMSHMFTSCLERHHTYLHITHIHMTFRETSHIFTSYVEIHHTYLHVTHIYTSHIFTSCLERHHTYLHITHIQFIFTET